MRPMSQKGDWVRARDIGRAESGRKSSVGAYAHACIMGRSLPPVTEASRKDWRNRSREMVAGTMIAPGALATF